MTPDLTAEPTAELEAMAVDLELRLRDDLTETSGMRDAAAVWLDVIRAELAVRHRRWDVC